MPLHLIQLTDKEWMEWQAVIGVAHLLSVNLKAGSYKGAIGDSPAAKALRADLTALINASDKIETNTDALDPEASTVPSRDKAMELATASRSSEASNRGARRGQPAKTPATPETAPTEPEAETTTEPDTDPRNDEEDTGA